MIRTILIFMVLVSAVEARPRRAVVESIGATGPTGAAGVAGSVGSAGSQGIQGIQGVIGVTGPTGLTGPAMAFAAGADSLTTGALSKTVTIGATMPDTSYHVAIAPGNALFVFRVDNKTTTTFDITVSVNLGTNEFTFLAVNY